MDFKFIRGLHHSNPIHPSVETPVKRVKKGKEKRKEGLHQVLDLVLLGNFEFLRVLDRSSISRKFWDTNSVREQTICSSVFNNTVVQKSVHDCKLVFCNFLAFEGRFFVSLNMLGWNF